MTLRPEVIDRIEDLDRLAPEWHELCQRCPSATPFQSPAWLIPWWRAFTPGDLYTLSVRQDGSLVALAPCYIERETNRLLPLGIGTSDYLDIVVDGRADPCTRHALLALFARSPSSHWEFSETAPDASVLALSSHRVVEQVEPSSMCPVLDLSAGLSSISRTQLRKVAMARNRIARRGELAIEDSRQDQAFLSTLISQHTAAWNAKGEAGLYADARVHDHHRNALPLLSRAGFLRAYTLRIGGVPAATLFALHWGHRTAAYLAGYDPAFSFESPGTVLVHHAIATAAKEGATEFHFLRGREPYKYRWGATDRQNVRVTYARVKALADAS